MAYAPLSNPSNILDTPKRYDLFVGLGGSLSHSFKWISSVNADPVDLTGYTAEFKISSHSGIPILTLDSGGSYITITSAEGLIEVQLTPTQTTALGAGDYSYHISLTDPDGNVKFLVKGNFFVRSY